jgi:serine/threonine-protein kinase
LPIGNTQPAVVEKYLMPTKKIIEKKQENVDQRLVGKASPSKRKLNLKKMIGIMIQGLLGVIVVVGLILTFWNPTIPKPSFLETTQIDAAPSLTTQPGETLSVIQTKISTIAPPSLPTEITDAKGVSMVLVPEGEFVKGSKGFEIIENLESFYIDRYEVTNYLYSLCVSDGGCDSPANHQLGDYDYYGNSQYDNYPVVWVNFDMAQTYCKWRDARLPLVSEWEKAARGMSGFLYPWGNELDEVIRENSYISGYGYSITSPVGSFSEGVSPFGIYDMAGNVSEWVAGGIAMGNSWRYGDMFMFDSNDYPQISNSSSPNLGIRCAKDAP